MGVRRVSVAGLKARLSEYLAAARAGESVLVTDRGRPVARLEPISGSEGIAGRLADLVRAGLARGPRSPLDPSLLQEDLPKDPEGRGIAAIVEERAEGW